jgi:hypothetical protein
MKKIQPLYALGLGDDRNWNLPDSFFAELAISFQLQLDDDFCNDIRTALRSYIYVANMDNQAANALETLAKLNNLEKNSKRLLKNLDTKTMSNEEVVLLQGLESFGFDPSKASILKAMLSELHLACAKAREELADRVRGGSGRAKIPGIDIFAWSMSVIFQRGGGMAAGNWNPNANFPDGRTGGRDTPFTRFAYQVALNIPQEIRLEFRQFSEALSASLERMPKGWVLPWRKLSDNQYQIP